MNVASAYLKQWKGVQNMGKLAPSLPGPSTGNLEHWTKKKINVLRSIVMPYYSRI